ncbi:hypothetical protein GGI42DRAFT_337627 [Trichoderma sp. SZMC 28013]
MQSTSFSFILLKCASSVWIPTSTLLVYFSLSYPLCGQQVSRPGGSQWRDDNEMALKLSTPIIKRLIECSLVLSHYFSNVLCRFFSPLHLQLCGCILPQLRSRRSISSPKGRNRDQRTTPLQRQGRTEPLERMSSNGRIVVQTLAKILGFSIP